MHRAFDYLVPDELVGTVEVGTLIRVPLRHRRVRGWIVELDVEPETDEARLVPILAVASAGPPADLVALSEWAAWRWAGPRAAFLRAASPENRVRTHPPEREFAVYPGRSGPPSAPGVIRSAPSGSRAALVRDLVAAEGSTIVVAPDPRDQDELALALEAEGREVHRWSSARPAAIRTRAWAEARRGACVVVGGRLAALAPVPDLAAVVLLDDADEALKEERVPAWHARDLLIERARRIDARVHVVSPAPTLDALEALAPGSGTAGSGTAGSGTSGAGDTPRVAVGAWPRLEVVDLRDGAPGTGLLSEPLADQLHAALARGRRAVCVLNRRGRARLLACRSCRELVTCERCDAAVTQVDDGLACPRCAQRRPVVCTRCHGVSLRAIRPGIVHVRDQLAALVPRARVVSVDGGGTLDEPFDVAIGTEAVLHRLPEDDGPPVGLVAFCEFDQELLAPRYRAGEQALWLLVRAARLVGTRRDGGVVLVQTRRPGDPVLDAGAGRDPHQLLELEAERRRALRFPPYGGLAVLRGDAAAVEVAAALLTGAVEVLGPHDGRALLRAADVTTLCDAIAAVDLAPARATGRLAVEVDPLRV